MDRFNRIKLFKSTRFWILVAAFVIALIVIMLGDNMFDSLASLSLRLLIGFSIFFGSVMAILLLKIYGKQESPEELQEKKNLRDKEKANEDIVNTKVSDLKIRFAEATKIIKNSSIYNTRDASYELPWYLVVGREKEGKTSLLESSGLDFPLNVDYQQRSVMEAGSTQSFQWYFAEHAIFVDMPGKFISQEAGSVDQGVWKAFLQLFKKKRWKRPINGVVLTLSVETLMGKNEVELEQYAKGLRDRFDELSSAFTSSIPIYLFVTKTDKIPGFNEYFSTLNDTEKDEILGMTFDENKNIDSSVVQPEFETLIKRLDDSILDRIHQEWDSASRSKILFFCDELSLVFEKLKMFIDMGFAQTRYRAPLMLRGIYFSSIMSDALPSYTHNTSGTLPQMLSNKGLFIRKVLSDVIFRESHIIKMDSTTLSKQKIRQYIGVIVAVVLVALISIAWLVDYNRHSQTIETLNLQIKKYEESRSALNESDDFEHRLNLLNTLYSIKTADADESSSRFWKLSFFKVEERQEKLDGLYYLYLEKILLPQTGSVLESHMLAHLDSYDLTWENTKGYLMLNKEDKRNNRFLEQWMEKIWALEYPEDSKRQRNLNGHWKRLLAHGFKPYEINPNSVQIARNKLAGFGQEALLYKQIKDKAQEMNLKDFQFAKGMGGNAPLFVGNDYIIPGFYTKEGYQKIFTLDSKTLLKEIIRLNWVLGYSTELKDSELDVVYAKIQNYYFADYKRIWMEALNSLYIRPNMSPEEMKILTSQDSPIISVLKGLKHNTDIYSIGEILEKKAMEKYTTKSGNTATLIPANEVKNLIPDASVKTIRDFFKPYHQLISEEGAAGPTLQAEMTRLENASSQTGGPAESGSPADAFNAVISRANGQGMAMSSEVSPLPAPVSRWLPRSMNGMGKLMSQGKQHINQQFMAEVYPFYKNKLANKYPFNPKATSDVALSDFEEFFRTGGVLDRFQSEYINPFVNLNPVGRGYQVKRVDGAAMPIDSKLIESLFVARDIRRMFFARGDLLGTSLYIKPNTLDKSLGSMSLRYDDSYIVYEHGPIKARKVSWPAQSGNADAQFQLLDLDNNSVASFNNEGEWGLFKLLSRMRTTPTGADSITVEYTNNSYRGSYIVNGSAAKALIHGNPIQKFTLKGRM